MAYHVNDLFRCLNSILLAIVFCCIFNVFGPELVFAEEGVRHWNDDKAIRIVNFAVLIGFLICPIVALFSLRKKKLTGLASGVWALIILAVPFFGVLAYFIVNPQDKT